MSAKLRAIDQYLPQLKRTIEHSLPTISGECMSKRIITPRTHQNLLQSRRSRSDKASYLISNVRKSIRQDETKCEQFLQILSRYKSRNWIVRRIKENAAELESHIVAEEDGFDQARSTLIPSGSNSHENGNSENAALPIVIGRALFNTMRGSSSQTEALHFAGMDMAQAEAKLADLQERNLILQDESKQAQERRDSIRKEKDDLENELHAKDRLLENMVTTHENLVHTIERLKQKVAINEKQKYRSTIDQQSLKKDILKYKDQIAKLQKERKELSVKYKKIAEEYQNLQDRVDLLETISVQHDIIQEELTQLKKQTSQQQHHCSVCCKIKTLERDCCKIILIILALSMVVCTSLYSSLQ